MKLAIFLTLGLVHVCALYGQDSQSAEQAFETMRKAPVHAPLESINSEDYMHPLDKAINTGDVEQATQHITSKQMLNDARRTRPFLHNAAIKGNVELVNLLINRGAYLNATDSIGMTCMHRLAYGNTPNYRAVIEALLHYPGVMLTKKNNVGQTPLDIAKQAQKADIIELFQAYSPPFPGLESYKCKHTYTPYKPHFAAYSPTCDEPEQQVSSWKVNAGYFVGSAFIGILLYKFFAYLTRPKEQQPKQA